VSERVAAREALPFNSHFFSIITMNEKEVELMDLPRSSSLLGAPLHSFRKREAASEVHSIN